MADLSRTVLCRTATPGGTKIRCQSQSSKHSKVSVHSLATRFEPMISEKNQRKCVKFAIMCIDTNDEFENVIWTDESSVQLKRHGLTMCVTIGEERQLKPQAKHTLKVISAREATKILSLIKYWKLHFTLRCCEDSSYHSLKRNFRDLAIDICKTMTRNTRVRRQTFL